MEDIYRFEFTVKEISDLTGALTMAKVDDELFIKTFADADDSDLCERLKDEIRRYDALLDKLRKDYT